MNWPASLAGGERGLRRRRSSFLVLVLSILAGACAQAPEAAQPAGSESSVSPAASTASPTSSGAEQATPTTKRSSTTATRAADPGGGLGAPFDIPANVGEEGDGVGDTLKLAEKAFAEACGADPCRVRIEVAKPRHDATRAHCPIVFSGRTSPPAGSRVRRGSVVKLIFEHHPDCEPETPTTETTADGDQQGTGGDGSGGDGSTP